MCNKFIVVVPCGMSEIHLVASVMLEKDGDKR
jgi:hypothetical protein